MRSMDNLTLNASSQKLVLGFTTNPRTDGTFSNKPLFCSFKTPKRSCALSKSKFSLSTPRAINKSNESLGKDWSARSSSSSNQETSSEVGSLLLWVGVGIALSPVFSSAASYFKKYAMTMIEKMDKQNIKSATAGLSNGSDAKSASVTIVAPAGFAIEVTQVKQSATSEQGSTAASLHAKKCSVTIALPAGFETVVTRNNQSAVTVDAPPTKTEAKPAPVESKDDTEILKDSKKSGMSQSPQALQQMLDMINFGEQAGLIPEEAFCKLLSNPDAFMACLNPRVLAASFDLAEDPLNINKYQDDKEVMDGINKMRELFMRETGAP